MSASPSFLQNLSVDESAFTQICEGVLKLEDPFELMCGKTLEPASIAYRLIGDPDLPTVLVMGGISAGRHAWTQAVESNTGWWQEQIGPGQSCDTQRFSILAFDFLGGNGESTSPVSWAGKSGYESAEFPSVDTADQADLVVHLLNELGIDSLHSVIGASYGGMVAQQFAARHPHKLKKALVVCAGNEPSPLATGWRHVQRQVLSLGLETGEIQKSVAIARSLAMCTYRSEREFSRRFQERTEGQHSASAYLDHCGARFAEIFDIYAYLCLSQSIDDHQVEPERISVPVDLVGFNTDQIVPVHQLISMRQRLGGKGSLTLSDSIYGHDAFLKETGAVSRIIREHLEIEQ